MDRDRFLHIYENSIKSLKDSFRTCTEQTFHNNAK